eukprot:TRINITY_DN4410_c0_g1_i3.p1 TRINITY_DN4410_c0_g1~~TRINITY_DN4410_c0_g1_i3.p1  ORF type:complete len:117 (+),score=9.86 TRINITY_DN4410_c0_g1_i3:432-782(+)
MPKKEKYKEWFYVLNRYSSQEEYRILVKNFKPTFIDPLSRPDDPVTITKMLEEPCFKSGWLETRESGLIRVWRWRWIVLEESSLQVFDSEELESNRGCYVDIVAINESHLRISSEL